MFWQLEFGMAPAAPLWNLKASDCVWTVDTWDMVTLQAFFLKSSAEILRGELTVFINSTITKKYTIPRQTLANPFGNPLPELMDGTTASNVMVRVLGVP